MKKLLFISCCLLAVFFSACKKNLLDSKPLNSYTDISVFQDSVLTSLYVNGIYRAMPSEYENINNYDMLGNFTDESHDNRTSNSSYLYDQNQLNATNAPFNSFWSTCYTNIRSCNVFLEHVNDLKASAALKNRLTGEVRFLRALYYHYLYDYFGAFPIITTTLTTTDNNLYTPRASEADCITFITSEFKKAADALPVKYTGADVGRATKGAALAFACRTYLYAGQWQNASDAATAVFNLNTYSLFPDYAGLFYTANENNQEVIFDKQYTALVATGQYTYVDYNGLTPNITGRNTNANNPSGNIVDAYEMTDGTAFNWSNATEAAHPYANRDPRMEASIIHDGSVIKGVTIDMMPGSTANPLSRPSMTNYGMRKFMDPNYDVNNTTNQSGQNFIMLRYAEVLLNYAEAQYNLGNTEEARKYVNMVRARASVNLPAITTANFNMDKLRHERFIELAFEGLRLWDINRWKIGPDTRGANSIIGVKITGTGTPGNRTYGPFNVNTGRSFVDKMYLFPIPYNEIIKYPASSPLTQNPGW